MTNYGRETVPQMGHPLYIWALRSALARGYRIDTVRGALINPKGEALRPSFCPAHEYPVVHVQSPRNPSRRVQIRMHKIIAWGLWGEASIAPRIDVRHIDNDKTNNCPANLALGTRRENILDMPREQRHALAVHRGHGNKMPANRKMSDDQVREVCAFYAANSGNGAVRRGARTELAARFGVDVATIRYWARKGEGKGL